jgi:SP family arabinose:H+ symporter-like MFS transporter
MLEAFGVANTFLIYAILTAPAFVFVWCLIPETKGKTLEEIEKHWFDTYNKGSNNVKN